MATHTINLNFDPTKAIVSGNKLANPILANDLLVLKAPSGSVFALATSKPGPPFASFDIIGDGGPMAVSTQAAANCFNQNVPQLSIDGLTLTMTANANSGLTYCENIQFIVQLRKKDGTINWYQVCVGGNSVGGDPDTITIGTEPPLPQ